MKTKFYKRLLPIVSTVAILIVVVHVSAFGTGTNQPYKDAVLFRFVPGKLMFFSPYKGNETSIQDVMDMIDAHKKDIQSGKAVVAVRGYCESFGNDSQNRIAAKNRSNQVKSYFITNYWMKEKWYNTINHVTSYYGIDGVSVVVFIKYIDGRPTGPDPIVENIEEYKKEDRIIRENLSLEPVSFSPQQLKQAVPPLKTNVPEFEPERKPFETQTFGNQTVESLQNLSKIYTPTRWYLKTNFLYDLALMPSLEVEYRFNDHWSAAVEGNVAWWKNTGKIQYYQMSTIIPEARWWFKTDGQRRGHYLGAFLGGGWYDLENGGTGYKGEGILTGLSYGYMFPVGKALAFEAGVGLGYMNTWYEVYEPIDNCFVYQESRVLNYFGPVRLRFSLVWNIGYNKKTGGAR